MDVSIAQDLIVQGVGITCGMTHLLKYASHVLYIVLHAQVQINAISARVENIGTVTYHVKTAQSAV